MTKKWMAMLLLVLMLVPAFAGCKATTTADKDTSWTDIQKKGEFVMGLDDQFPPMGFRDATTNDIIGFDVDMAQEAARRMGVKVVLTPIDWTTKETILNSKRIDVIWNGYSISDERKQQVAFTKPYLDNRQIIIVLKDSAIKAKADLEGKTIGLQEGSSAADAVVADPMYDKIGEDKVKKYADNNAVLMDLKAGRIDAMVVDEVVGRYYISMTPDVYVVLEDNFGSEEYGIGVRKTDVAFLEKLQATLDAMKADGKSAEISKKWFGGDFVK